MNDLLYKKLKPIFQEYSNTIFKYEDIEDIINNQYKPRVIDIIACYNDNELHDDFEDNVNSPEFQSFF